MLEIEDWDKDPDGGSLPVMRCVVCGDYCTGGDLLGIVLWMDDAVVTIPLAYHLDDCARRFEATVDALHGVMLDTHIADRISQLGRNVDEPPVAGEHGLIRPRPKHVDLRRTADFIDAIPKP